MASKAPASGPTGSPDKQRDWLEGFSYEFRPLAESEYQRDTNMGINNCPKAIKKVGDNLVVIRWSGTNTIYDSRGKIVTTVPATEPGKWLVNESMKQTLERAVRRIANYRSSGSQVSFTTILEELFGTQQVQAVVDGLVTCGLPRADLTTDMNPNTLESKLKFQYSDLSKIPDLEGYSRAVGESQKSYFFEPSQTRKLQENGVDLRSFFHYTFDHAAISIGYDGSSDKMFAIDYKKTGKDSLELRELKLDQLPRLSAITGIGIDYGQNFLFIGMGNSVFVYEFHHDFNEKDRSKPLRCVSKFHDDKVKFEGQILGQSDGSILVGDSQGNLRKIQTNLHTLDNYTERERKEREAARLGALTIARPSGGNGRPAVAGAPAGAADKLDRHQKEASDRYLRELTPEITAAKNVEDIKAVHRNIERVKAEVMVIVRNQKTVALIFAPVMELLAAREVEIWREYFNGKIAYYTELRQHLKRLPPSRLATESRNIETDRRSMTVYPRAVPVRGMEVIDEIQGEIQDVLQGSEGELIKHVETQFAALRSKVGTFTKRKEFEDWLELDYPVFIESVQTQMKIAPASHTNFTRRCAEIMTEVGTLRRTKKREFDTKLDEIRKVAAGKIESLVTFAQDRIAEFLEQLTEKVNGRAFSDVDTARRWMETAKTYETAMKSIEALDTDAKDRADDLRQRLKSEVASLIYTVRRQKDTIVDATSGSQMTVFGKTSFPIWEAKVEQSQQKREVRVEVIYKVDDRTKGPGISPDDYKCELFYKITRSDGKVEDRPLAQDDMKRFGYDDERYFDVDSKGSYFPSYMTVRNAKKIMNAMKIMGRSGDPLVAKEGDHEIKKKYAELRARRTELNKRMRTLNDWIQEQERQGKPLDKLPPEVATQRDGFKKESVDLAKEYITFLQESGLYVWQRLRAVTSTITDEEKERGEDSNVARQGKVPTWERYWVMDEEAERVLEEFSEKALISLEGKEGLLSLEGHAGTGKDVIVDMFCEKTRRPKFTFDASKWTTEFDLSQDVSLAAESGASFTVKEDSIVVKAMQTPGAVLYFNEFNAMPETAQMFLHSLFDAKRQITLKTSSGRIVKAAQGFLAVASMNIGPGYEGTNKPQKATRSRMLPTQVKYPEFARRDSSGRITSYSGAEALRAARSIRSLADFTWDPDMKENEFIKLWDIYINKQQSDPRLTPEVKYDIEVLFNILYIGNELRTGFINKQKGAQRGVFTVDQPFTLRDLRRCAIALGRMDQKDKMNIDTAEETARALVKRFYVPLLYSEKEQDDIVNKLSGPTAWSATKP